MKRYIIILATVISMLMVVAAPTLAQAQTQTAGTCVQFYQVQRGDWLSRIAATFGTTWQYLASINGLSNPNRIFAGQILCVSVFTPPPQQTTYVVQRGDWLSRIAQRFGVSLLSLIQANNITNPNFIFPGQVLIIPAAGFQPLSTQSGAAPANGGVMNQPIVVLPANGGVVNPPAPNATPEAVG